jgi:hypothetical protein
MLKLEEAKRLIKSSTGFCQRCAILVNQPYEDLYKILIRNSKPKGIEVSLTFDEFLMFTEIGCCHYCGEKNIEWKEYGGTAYNLDRKNSDTGYVLTNIVVCCAKCNYRKGNYYSHQEFMAISEVLKFLNVAGDHGYGELLLYLTNNRFLLENLQHGRKPI